MLNGPSPVLRGFDSQVQELDAVAAQVTQWLASDSPEGIAVCVPTHDLVQRVTERLTGARLPWFEITPDGPKGADGIAVGTMHRFKGLEFRQIVIAGASEGLLPRRGVDRLESRDPIRFRREVRRDRSLLFVAATRARDELALFWHGQPSRFLRGMGAKFV